MVNQLRRRVLEEKLAAFVAAEFGGDDRAAFDEYDTNGDGLLDRVELRRLLADAGVGAPATRGLWAAGVIAEVDYDGDGAVSWADYVSTPVMTAAA